MKKTLLIILFVLLSFEGAMAQTGKEAAAADVATIDGIMKAVYDVISGNAGQKRDWDRFQSLFYKDARLIATGKKPRLVP
ncbi:MAG: hypothetical protein ACR2IH_01470 [Pyrinomonadaceae bacterium]